MHEATATDTSFETLLGELSARFIQLAPEQVDCEIERALQQLAEFLGTDRASFGAFSEDVSGLLVTHSWARPGIGPAVGMTQADLPWYFKTVLRGETIVLSRAPDDLPEEATREKEYMLRSGLKSNLGIPIAVAGHNVCVLATGTFREYRAWTETDIQRVRAVAEILAGALHRARADKALRAAEEQNRSVLASLTSMVAVLDREGSILSVNDAWRRALREAGLPRDAPQGVGVNYLEVCRASAAAGVDEARRAYEGIQSVLKGERELFELPYRCEQPSGSHFFTMRVTPLAGSRPGAVVSHVDVTELETARSRLEVSFEEIRRLKERLEVENVYLREEIRSERGFEEIVGKSPALHRVLEKVSQVAATDAAVLLLGDTGTGKELLARAIHERSPRRGRALVKVNCAALPPTLVESELFGHERGAFTGATAQRPGRFEVADGGTLFLDEVGDLPAEVQVKLLRVLQEGEFERVGSSRTRRADVRLIAATHQDLEKAVAEGGFRRDLYYRLNVFPIQVPPLRERREDIPLLVWAFINRRQSELGRAIREIPRKAMDELLAYGWPGNVRELENVIERAMILSHGPTLSLDESFGTGPASPAVASEALGDMQRSHILGILERCSWKINGRGNAAELLALHPNTLRSRMNKLGIRRPRA